MDLDKTTRDSGLGTRNSGIHLLSVVIPFYNESESIDFVIQELHQVLGSAKIRFEIVAIDDGSHDQTWARLLENKKKIPALHLIRLKINCGQTQALAAGLEKAKGDWILTMDGDGQNDPHSIPALLEKAREGFDVVSGWRKNRKDAKLTRIIPSACANALLSAVSGLKLHDSGCSLKLYKARAIRSITLYADRHRFIPLLIHLRGFRVAEVVVNHRPRIRGQSKYGLSRTLKVLLDMIVLALYSRFSEAPRFYFFLTAIPFFVLGLIPIAMVSLNFSMMQELGTGIVYFGTSFLLIYTAISLVVYGLLIEWMAHIEREKL